MPTHVGGWTVQMLKHMCAQAQCFGLQPHDLQSLPSQSSHIGFSLLETLFLLMLSPTLSRLIQTSVLRAASSGLPSIPGQLLD